MFVTFEETEDDPLKNAASLGYDVPGLIARNLTTTETPRRFSPVRVEHSGTT